MSTIKVRFVDELPPRAKTGRKPGKGKYAKVADKLRKQPGRWAWIASVQGRNQVYSLRSRLTAYGVQVAIRVANGGWYRVYARYNPKTIDSTPSE